MSLDSQSAVDWRTWGHECKETGMMRRTVRWRMDVAQSMVFAQYPMSLGQANSNELKNLAVTNAPE